MPTVNISGVILNAASRVPGPQLRVYLVPAGMSMTDSALITAQHIEAEVDQESGSWNCDILPSTEVGHGYRIRAWWLGPNPGTGIWFDDGVGLWVTDDGVMDNLTLHSSGSAPDPDVEDAYQLNTATLDLYGKTGIPGGLLVYKSPTAPDEGTGYQYQLNTTTGDMFGEDS